MFVIRQFLVLMYIQVKFYPVPCARLLWCVFNFLVLQIFFCMLFAVIVRNCTYFKILCVRLCHIMCIVIVYILVTFLFVIYSGPVHNNPFSFENAYFLMRLGLPPTLIRRFGQRKQSSGKMFSRLNLIKPNADISLTRNEVFG